MYIGSPEKRTDVVWLMDEQDFSRLVRKKVEYIPALCKLFDEVLVNAADNKQRDKRMKEIDVIIEDGNGTAANPPRISVRNDGRGVPVQIHKTEKIYVPELVFGHLLTGSNFDDGQGRLTGGRHGYGAKLTNIFSSEFSVETLDSKEGKLFRQTWTGGPAPSAAPSEALPLFSKCRSSL
jgi:DNA topoisomerase-2